MLSIHLAVGTGKAERESLREQVRILSAENDRLSTIVNHLGVPCAAHPSTGARHFDGPCRCFFGGPAPAFPTPPDAPQAS